MIRHTGQWDLAELELLVSLDAKGHAAGLLYEDAGDGYGYRRGEFRLTRFVATSGPGDGDVTIAAEHVAGGWPAAERRLKVSVLSKD